MRTRIVLALSMLVGLTVVTGVSRVVAATTNAGQDSDSSPPMLTTAPWAAFPLGTQVTTDAADPQNPGPRYSHVARQISWSVADASGVCTSTINPINNDEQALAALGNSPSLRSVVAGASDYDGTFGGEQFVAPWWRVRVEDCVQQGLNNGAYAIVRGGTPAFTQDDGQELGTGGQGPVTIAYAGTWATSTCTCWSGDTARKTTTPGSSATITGTFVLGERIALVMATGPDRGQFDLYFDGAKKATVDTHAASTLNRVVVWTSAMPGGSHTVKIVDVGTVGRPRIDLDVVITH